MSEARITASPAVSCAVRGGRLLARARDLITAQPSKVMMTLLTARSALVMRRLEAEPPQALTESEGDSLFLVWQHILNEQAAQECDDSPHTEEQRPTLLPRQGQRQPSFSLILESHQQPSLPGDERKRRELLFCEVVAGVRFGQGFATATNADRAGVLT